MATVFSDAQALVTADVGIAIGAVTDVAVEAGGVPASLLGGSCCGSRQSPHVVEHDRRANAQVLWGLRL